jgi:hypothetical protein
VSERERTDQQLRAEANIRGLVRAVRQRRVAAARRHGIALLDMLLASLTEGDIGPTEREGPAEAARRAAS